MSRERVSESMRRHGLRDFGLASCPLTDSIDSGDVDWPICSTAREQPVGGFIGFPVLAQQSEQVGRQHHKAILTSFALPYLDDHSGAVDVGGQQVGHL